MQLEPRYAIETLESEPRVEFETFSRDDAAQLGETAIALIRERGLSLAVDVHFGSELVFRVQLGRTGQSNSDFIAGKRLVVARFGCSSLLAKLKKEADPSIADGLGEEYKFWGGSVPLFVGGALFGTISASGEADIVDHQVVADALVRFRGVH